jgi:hypothetical protein
LILHHYAAGEELYLASRWEPAIGEWRKFIEAVLRGTAEASSAHRTDIAKSVGTMKDVLDYLAALGFFDSEERLAHGNVYGLLSSGTKPGILPSTLARTAMIQAVTDANLLLEKYITWRKNGYHF